MTDPESQKEAERPARPPRPTQPTSTAQSQLEADEMYARQLAEHYGGAGRQAPRGGHGDPRTAPGGPRRRPSEYSDDDREHSFFDG